MKLPDKPYLFEALLRDIQNRSRRRLDLYTVCVVLVFVAGILSVAVEVFGHD